MKDKNNQDLAIKFDVITRKLKASGADLSKIKITLEKGSMGSYITKRIMEEMR